MGGGRESLLISSFLSPVVPASAGHILVEDVVVPEATRPVPIGSEEGHCCRFASRVCTHGSDLHLKTVMSWEKSHVSQRDFHVPPTSFPYLPTVRVRQCVQKVPRVAVSMAIAALLVSVSSWAGGP